MSTLQPNQLTRHAICLGMTGSGKTGLCVGILEDLALQGVPVLAVDPKGDLANLALVLDPTPEAYAGWVPDPAATAAAWRDGLAAAGIDDLQAFRDAVDVRVLTPGAESAAPVDVLTALTTAPPGLDDEARRDYVQGAVAALLGLIDHDGDPRTDPAAILLCRLLGDAFARGESLSLDQLIPAVVDPPVTHVGYFHVDTFLSRDDRLDLAKRLNTVLASPAFVAWRRGVPLDVDAWLTPRTPEGKAPITVLYLAHLDEPGRRFFLTLLLHAVVSWSRRQPGTPNLRAALYLDEVAGTLPPHPANPPTKWPALTLLKQARAVGLGVMLASQNPVDIDYKAMSNAGTWLVGRLRTKQDRRRVLDGLDVAGVQADPSAVDDQLAALPARTFLVLDDHGLRTITSRHTRALLRGPLTRAEVTRLVRSRPSAASPDDGLLPHPPPLPDGLTARWLRTPGLAALRAAADADPTAAAAGAAPVSAPPLAEDAVWTAALYGRIHVRFDALGVIVHETTVHRLVLPDAPVDALTDQPAPAPTPLDDAWLARTPPPAGRYAPLPGWLADARRVDALTAAWIDHARVTTLGPDEAPQADAVRLVGVAVVWIPLEAT
jgi:hypothetical protein